LIASHSQRLRRGPSALKRLAPNEVMLTAHSDRL